MDVGLVLPVWEDNGPQVVMEMLNNHLPVIATSMGGIPDFVNSDNGFLFNPYAEDGIEKVVDFINSLSISQINSMRKHVCRTLTPNEHCNKIREIYRRSAAVNK